MTRKREVTTRYISDLSGAEGATEARTLSVGRRRTMHLDLTPTEAAEFDSLLAPYVAAARTEEPERRRDTAAVREWANANGQNLGARGRIPQAVFDDYDRVHTGSTQTGG